MTHPRTPSSKTTLTRLANYTLFAFLSLILLCLILLTPADAIYQCWVTNRLTNIFIITGGYVVTFLLTVLIYATRIYTNRSVLGGIPKAWIPIEKEDVGKSVRRIVVEGLGRSALVAGGSRPRDLTTTNIDTPAGAGEGASKGEEKKGLLGGFDFDIDPDHPPWGVIEHPGWSAPSSTSTNPSHLPPGLCYRTVVRELPHLIEAKAVSLAPSDPILSSSSHNPHLTRNQPQSHTDDWAEPEEEESMDMGNVPDTRIVEILRRPATMSLRSYLQHLIKLGIINPAETGIEFLSLYECARFSGRDLSETEFRALMGVFADVLRGMRFSLTQLDLHLDLDLDLPGRGRGSTRRDDSTFGTRSESVIGPSDEEGETETDTLGSVSVHSTGFGYNYTSGATFDGASGRGRGRGRAQQWPSTPSIRSLRPVRSNVSGSSSGSSSGSGGGVIRLADARTESVSGLPYVIGG